MSISAVSQAPSSTLTEAQAVEKLKTIFNPDRWTWLIPTITGIAIGILFVPYFGLGLAVGFGQLIITGIALSILKKMNLMEEDKNSEYERGLRGKQLHGSLFIPIAEESIFRGGIQPILARTIQTLAPAAAASFLGAGFNVATAASILITGTAFGAVHYLNPHKNAHIQAVYAGVGGIVLGFMSAQFGIGSAVAAHIAFNTISSIAGNFKTSVQEGNRVTTIPLNTKHKVTAHPQAPAWSPGRWLKAFCRS